MQCACSNIWTHKFQVIDFNVSVTQSTWWLKLSILHEATMLIKSKHFTGVFSNIFNKRFAGKTLYRWFIGLTWSVQRSVSLSASYHVRWHFWILFLSQWWDPTPVRNRKNLTGMCQWTNRSDQIYQMLAKHMCKTFGCYIWQCISVILLSLMLDIKQIINMQCSVF